MLSFGKKKLYRRLRHFLHKREHICLIDEKYFFIDELPVEGLPGSKRGVERFVRLRVEAISPFALGDVMYGFFKGKSKLTIFIAYRHRLESTLRMQHSHVFPEFFPRLLAGCDFAVESARVSRNGNIIFSSASGNVKLRATDAIVFNADLRDLNVKKHAKFMGRLSKFLNCGICCCMISLPLLCVCLGYLFWRDVQLGAVGRKIEDRKSEVSDVASKSAFLENISKFYTNGNFCLAALEAINRVRQDDISFTDVHCDANGKSLRIRGHAPSASVVVKYCSEIRQCRGVRNVEASNVHSHDRRTSFAIDVQFE
jgi:hypothetical protein